MATRPNVYRNKKKYTRKEKFKKDLVDWNKIHIFVKQIRKRVLWNIGNKNHGWFP